MIIIKRLDKQQLVEFRQLLALFSVVLEGKPPGLPDEPYLQQLLERDSFFVYAAIADDIVIGGLTAHLLPQYPSRSFSVYIYDLAVAENFRRMGAATMLLNTLKTDCVEQGFNEVYVQTCSDDINALSFYRSTGAEENAVRHFTYPL